MRTKGILVGGGLSFFMRLKYIDISKGIGILLIIFAHRCGFPGDLGKYLTAFSVQLFFVLGGGMHKEKESFSQYACSRFKKIIIPYFAYNLLCIFIYLSFGWITGWRALYAALGMLYSTYCLYLPITAENNIFFYQVSNGPTWFMTAFFISNLLFWLVHKRRFEIKVLYCLIAVLLTKLFGILPICIVWNLDKAFIGSVLMLIGYQGASDKICDCKINKKIGLFIISSILFLGGVKVNPNINIATQQYGDSPVFPILLCILIGASGTYLCVMLSRVLEKLRLGMFLALLGRHSMILMALHLIGFRIIDNLSLTRTYVLHNYKYLEAILLCVVIVGIDCIVNNVKKLGKK